MGSQHAAYLCDTLERPNSISIGASGQRMTAALELGILQASVDAAVSVGASNSIEKMLAHQLAAAHHTAMKLLLRSAADKLPPGEIARLTNAGARMMDVYQAGCLTLLKLKTGGEQRVAVQYQQVNVGQAVRRSSPAVSAGARANRGRGGKNAR